MDLTFSGIVVHEADVALTDWLLAAECLLFTVLLLRLKPSTMRTLCTVLFVSLMAASLLGGSYHAFFPLKTTTPEGWWVWMGTMLSIGVTSATLLTLSAHLVRPTWTGLAVGISAVLLAGYAYWIMAINHEFRIAVLFYGPMLLLFLASLLIRFFRTRDWTLLLGVDSVVVMLIAAWAQQAQIGLHPQYFNHNALYHLLQGVALLMLFYVLWKQTYRSSYLATIKD